MDKTKKSLVSSTLALIMCIAMLIATTFAWFTDSVTSGKNTIKAGNLDIELEYFNGTAWNPVTSSTKLFGDENALWEPGYTQVAYLRLSNKGSLALKYNLSAKVYSETAGTNVKDESFMLSDYIKMGLDDTWGGSAKYTDRATARAAVSEAGAIDTFSKSGTMLKGASFDYFAVVAFMPETVGNEANYKTGTTPPTIELGVNVEATQLMSESDAFGTDYDKAAPWMGEIGVVPAADEQGVINVSLPSELAAVATEINADRLTNKTIKLANDIDLNNVEWIQINGAGKKITFDGNHKTIKNLKISNGHSAGFFATGSGCTIKNLTFEDAHVRGVGRVAVICGHGMCVTVQDCIVKNSTVTAVVTNNDDGDKVGAIVGYLSGEPEASVTGCHAEKVHIRGYRDIGGLVGYAGGTYTVTNSTVKDSTVTVNKTNNYKNYKTNSEFDANEIIGEKGTSGAFSGNTSTDVTVTRPFNS